MKLGDFETLSEARTYTESRGVILNANDMGVIFDKHPGSLSVLEAIENTDESVRIFLTLFRSGGGRFDFRKNESGDSDVETDGDRLSNKMNSLVEAGALTLGFATAVFNAANITVKPFENVSEYDWRKARGEVISTKQVVPANGWLKITTTQDVEPHRPQVYAEVQGIMQRVTGFGVVEKAGDYLAQIPRGHSVFYVDDHYRAIA